MPHIDPSWQSSAVTALVLFVLAVGAARYHWSLGTAALREAGLVVSLYAAWQLIGSMTHDSVRGAQAHALAVWHAEQALHLPSELALQQLVLPHPELVQACNAYYLYGHFNPIIALLAWVWFRHRSAYPRVRLLLVLLTATAFIIHFVPVAPPRLVPGLGFHDVALEYGQSVYGTLGGGLSGQLLAMPSLHVGWAILLAYVVVTTTRSRWRWLVVVHPVLMELVVAITANHWWADGVAGGGLLALCVAAERLVRRIPLPRRVPADRPDVGPLPVR